MAAIVSASEGALLAVFKPNSWMHLSAVLLTTGDYFCTTQKVLHYYSI